MATYFGRLSIDLSNSSLFIDAYSKRYQFSKFICYYETKDKAGDKEAINNPHLHFITEYINPKKSLRQDISEFMKQFKQYATHGGQQYYHKECKDIDKALAYTIKDGYKIISIGFTQEEIEAAEDKVLQFEEDTKKSALMKLNDRFQTYNITKKLQDRNIDEVLMLKEVKHFVFSVYVMEYKTEISMSRLTTLALSIIKLNGLLTEHEFLDLL